MSAAKGYRLGKSRLYATAKDQVQRSWTYAYRDRRAKKRNFRRLWISRINAACRQLGLTYSVFINRLSEHKIEMNRKVLADMAVHNPESFKQLVESIQS